MGILVTIGLWLVKIASSDLFKSVITVIVNDFIQAGKEQLPYVQAAVETAMSHTDWSGSQKLVYVKDTIKARFPGITDALLNRLIENVYAALKIETPAK